MMMSKENIDLYIDPRVEVVLKTIAYTNKMNEKLSLKKQKYYQRKFWNKMKTLGNDKNNLYNINNQVEEYFGWYYIHMIKNRYDYGVEKSYLKEIIDLFYKLVNFYSIKYPLDNKGVVVNKEIFDFLTSREKKLLMPKFRNNAVIHINDDTKLVFDLKNDSQIGYVKVVGKDIDTSIFYNIDERRYLFLDEAIEMMIDKKIVSSNNHDVKNRLKELDYFDNANYSRDMLLYLVGKKLFYNGGNKRNASFYRTLILYGDFIMDDDIVFDFIRETAPYLSIDTLNNMKAICDKLDWKAEDYIYIDEVLLEKERKELGKRLVRDLKVIRDRKLENNS